MGKYDDIIHLPHPVSGTHPPMPRAERAAQFSSFAALSGYEEAVAESARLTETRTELDRDALEELDKTIRALVAEAAERPEAVIRYFIQDEKKAGGRYETVRGRVKKIDEYAALLVLAEGKKIPLGDVVSIEKVEKA